MTLKNIIFLAFGVFSSIITAQEKGVYVEYENKLISTQETTGVLIANNNHALYKELPSSKKGELGVGQSPNGGNAVVYKPDVKESNYYKTKGSSLIYYTEYVVKDKTPYFVYDSIPELNWELIPNQTDTILGYICNKAKLKFRGSNLTAYYTNDISFSFGPWKFDGLPGLILKISEDEYPNKIYWEAKKIIFPYNEKSQLYPNKEKYTYSLKEFKIMSYNIYDKQAKEMQAKVENDAIKNNEQMSRGDRPKINKRPATVEKVYEWEIEGDIWLFYIDYLKKHPEYKIDKL